MANEQAEVVALAGDIDVSTVEEVRRALAAHMAVAGTDGPIVVDLGAVSFLDSTGIGALVEAKQEAELAGRDFHLRNVSAQHLRLLQITGLDDYLGVQDSEGEASRRLGA